MKKLLFILILLASSTFVFSLSKEKIDYDSLFTEIAQNFQVKKIELPDSRSEFYEEKNVKFADEDFQKSAVLKTEFNEKKKTYTIEFFDIKTIFCSTKGKFKIINEDNQIVQVCEFENIDNPYYGFFDCNMDGYLDLLIMDKKDKTGTSYFVYYWSNSKKQFEKDDHSFINFALDKKNDFIYERYVDKTKELVYKFYEYRFGIRRFVAEVRFSFTDYEKGYDFKIVYIEDEGKTEGDTDVYVFEFPNYQKFEQLTEEQQKKLRNQYKKMAEKIESL